MQTIKDWRNVLPPVFSMGVAQKTSRYAISEPFVYRDYVYATDGRLCLRMRLAKVVSSAEFDNVEGTSPPVLELPWDKSSGVFVAAPELGEPPAEIMCDHCRGRGGCSCNCGNEHDCGECNGSGRKGRVWRVFRIPGRAYGLNERYARGLVEAGAKAFELPPANDKSAPFRFTVGDVEGMLMPVREDGMPPVNPDGGELVLLK
jgi:hypothetical protein